MNSSWITFQEMYGSGEGLCNKMWEKAFYYSNDTDEYTVMAFDGIMVNPNIQLTFPEVRILPDVSDNGNTHAVYSGVWICAHYYAVHCCKYLDRTVIGASVK